MLVLGVRDTTEGRPRVNAHPCVGRLGRGHPGVCQRHQGAGQPKLRESIQPVGLFRGHEVKRLELHLSGHLARERGGVEAADPAHRRFPAPHAVPKPVGAVPYGGDWADAGDSDPPTLLSHQPAAPE